MEEKLCGRCQEAPTRIPNAWYCLSCTCEIKREQDRLYYVNNREQVIARVAKYRQDNLEEVREREKIYARKHKADKAISHKRWREENIDYVAEYKREWMEANKDRLVISRKQYYIDNSERIKANVKQYRQTPEGREIARISDNNRRARLAEVGGEITLGYPLYLLGVQNNRCIYCHIEFSDEIPYTIDHVVPIAAGGPNTDENIQLLCGPCNSRKHTTSHEDFIEYRKEVLMRED